MRQDNIVVAGMGGGVISPAELRQLKGPIWGSMDLRFTLIALASLLLNIAGMAYVHTVKLPPVKTVVLEQIPERFAKFLVEKPIPKANDKNVKPEIIAQSGESAAKAREEAVSEEGVTANAAPVTTAQRARAQKAVTARVAQVENKIRTVGVLGMLSGVGTTAKGPAVVDVLGAVRGRKESGQDLEAALSNMNGLQRTGDVSLVQKKLVKSKDVVIDNTESIDNLIQGISAAKTTDLAKQGNIVIQKPESIEGAASSSAKRDSKVINEVVLAHKTGIFMSYQKFLQRDPTLQGKITVRFTITASGRVVNAEILENTTGNRDLEDDIVRKVMLWMFEPIPEGDATVTYPFVFRPS